MAHGFALDIDGLPQSFQPRLAPSRPIAPQTKVGVLQSPQTPRSRCDPLHFKDAFVTVTSISAGSNFLKQFLSSKKNPQLIFRRNVSFSDA